MARISYLDFAGESLRDMYRAAPNPETQQLYSRFTGADVLMAVLDGVEVKRLWKGRPSRTFFTDLGTLLALLSSHQKAASLILTKWDVLEDDYIFSQVAARLLEIDVLANFVRSQRQVGASGCSRSVRLAADSSFRKAPARCASRQARHLIPSAWTCPSPARPDAVTAAGNRAESPRSRVPFSHGPGLCGSAWAPFSFGLEREGIQYAQYVMTATRKTPATTAQLIRYCQDKVTRLEAEFPESDLVRFQLRQGG